MDIRGHDRLQGLLQRVGRLPAGGRPHQLRGGHTQAEAAVCTAGGGNIIMPRIRWSVVLFKPSCFPAG